MQNKRLVDLLSDDSKNSFGNPGITAWKVGAKMILESVGIGTHAYKHGGVRGGGEGGGAERGAWGARGARGAREHAPRARAAPPPRRRRRVFAPLMD